MENVVKIWTGGGTSCYGASMMRYSVSRAECQQKETRKHNVFTSKLMFDMRSHIIKANFSRKIDSFLEYLYQFKGFTFDCMATDSINLNKQIIECEN